jgi:hypothetical protein
MNIQNIGILPLKWEELKSQPVRVLDKVGNEYSKTIP